MILRQQNLFCRNRRFLSRNFPNKLLGEIGDSSDMFQLRRAGGGGRGVGPPIENQLPLSVSLPNLACVLAYV